MQLKAILPIAALLIFLPSILALPHIRLPHLPTLNAREDETAGGGGAPGGHSAVTAGIGSTIGTTGGAIADTIHLAGGEHPHSNITTGQHSPVVVPAIAGGAVHEPT